MPRWIHDRADHIMSKNPGMDKSKAFAIATQQAYASDKAPKDFGTKEGRQEAKSKYDSSPASYEKKADPPQKSKTASLRLAFWDGFTNEFEKLANIPPLPQTPTKPSEVGKVVSRQKSALTLRKPNFSRPIKPEIPQLGPMTNSAI